MVDFVLLLGFVFFLQMHTETLCFEEHIVKHWEFACSKLEIKLALLPEERL